MCDNCDKEPEFVISETTNMTQRVDTYIKQDVGEEEYMCSNKAANSAGSNISSPVPFACADSIL